MKDGTPRGRLAGLRIATTREHTGALDEALQAEGAVVLHVPLIRVRPPHDSSALSESLGMIDRYDWIVFTSSNALRMVTADATRVLSSGRTMIACIGDATAGEAAAVGLKVSLLPKRQHVKGLIEAFAALEIRRGRVLYPRSEIAPGTLKEGLQALGFTVDDPVTYRTEPHEEGMKQFVSAMDAGLDAAVFASPSAFRAAALALASRQPSETPEYNDNARAIPAGSGMLTAARGALAKLRVYSIGPTTSAAIRDAGVEVAGEAAEHNVQSLAEAIIHAEENHE